MPQDLSTARFNRLELIDPKADALVVPWTKSSVRAKTLSLRLCLGSRGKAESRPQGAGAFLKILWAETQQNHPKTQDFFMGKVGTSSETCSAQCPGGRCQLDLFQFAGEAPGGRASDAKSAKSNARVVFFPENC